MVAAYKSVLGSIRRQRAVLGAPDVLFEFARDGQRDDRVALGRR